MNTVAANKAVIKELFDEFILPYQSRIALSIERQVKFFARKKSDACPVIIAPDAKIAEIAEAAFPAIPAADTENEFLRILTDALKANAMYAMTNHDRVINIFPAFGCSAGLTALGMEQKREHGNYGGYGPPDTLSQSEALALSIDNVQIRGDFKKRIDFIKYSREMLDDQIPILNSYVGGPFTLACGIMGTDFMMLTATDPKLAHEFLDFCIEAQKKLLLCLRAAAGADECKNTVLGGGLVTGGARAMQMDIDEAVMFSPKAIDEFIIPSTREFAARCDLNVQMLHYCGWHRPFSRAIAREKSIAALNNNPVPSHPPPPFEEVMQLCAENDTLYCGYWPPYDHEHPKDYLKRLNKWAKAGILFPEIRNIAQLECFASSSEVADYWYSL